MNKRWGQNPKLLKRKERKNRKKIGKMHNSESLTDRLKGTKESTKTSMISDTWSFVLKEKE